jgi:hypothetical protein
VNFPILSTVVTRAPQTIAETDAVVALTDHLQALHPDGVCRFCGTPLALTTAFYVDPTGAAIARVMSACAATDHDLGLEGKVEEVRK